MKRTRLIVVALIALASIAMPGCGSRRSHHHHNPDGSYSYYRFNHDHTSSCTCRSVYHPVYHPSSHYYHAHY
jgi:uncharacterized protein YceK